ncbi:WXG100 family type VII secretion target [Actinoplanes oblitus]|uniref:WXG100 family type VII secretion target n=1 Tax=Actinoplanes oblitus TaxID=3040509 RepID=A0ABY8WNI3_9ACTN|nr:WXG100 family type VII secretion target [Actinoplanes oblitus]WIM97874.1 WXG100 family type VII secretion target [Actinoplanes oblitus]
MTVDPLVARSADSTTRYTGLGLVEDAADITGGIRDHSWVDPALGGVGAGLDMLSLTVDPLGTLVSWGVAWLMEHVRPLKEALDWLAGNADEVAAHAATWANVAALTAQARERYIDHLQAEVAGWFGASGDAYRRHADAHLNVMEALSTAARGLSYAVEGAGLLVALVRGIVRDLVAGFIGTLAARLPQWLAEEGLTLGIASPVVAGQVATLVATWVNKIQHFVRALLSSLRRLHPMLDKLGDIFTELRARTHDLARTEPTTPGPAEHQQYFRHSDTDPLARWGPARQTHPDEWEDAVREAEAAGVEITFRSGGLAYGPSPSPGRPGVLILDPDASYGALLHEMQHMRDDRAAGWAGMRGWFEDPHVRYANEVHAYEQEIRYAESINDRDSVAKLKDLVREEYRKIFGENP